MEPKQKILIVDDSEINRAMLKEILGEGYEYLEAENGLRAIEILRRRTDIALVLLDIVMPVMDGLQAARAIRESSHPQAKEIPIIAQTANAFAEDVQRTQQAGMNDHISKPLNEAALLRVLAQYYRPQQ